MICYQIPPRVQLVSQHSRPLLTTAQGGRVALDATLTAMWQHADGKTLDEVCANFPAQGFTDMLYRATLACLAESGLLDRNNPPPLLPLPSAVTGPLVSVVIVSYNNRVWLDECLSSLVAQTYSPLEITIVDNGSSDDTATWVAAHYPHVKLVQLSSARSLAHALNQGVAATRGDFFLLLNPDVVLDPAAVGRLVAAIGNDPGCAAVAAKLEFMWAPSFLNGIGNHVGAFAWGADNGLGFLDLGQFDHWDTVPSACFAAALISRSAWDKIGKLDEGFPLYYEDNEWCYRARLMGYTIRAVPQAIVYHAFGGRVPNGTEGGSSPRKLENVVYGRLRFAVKLQSPAFLLRFLAGYILEDLLRFVYALLRLDGRVLQAYCRAWRNLLKDLTALLGERKIIQQQRKRSDHELYSWQNQVPPPLIWHGLPELTWDLVQYYYLPLILSGKTRALPEFAGVALVKSDMRSSWRSRARLIWRHEGWRSLVHRIAKYAQWRLAQV